MGVFSAALIKKRRYWPRYVKGEDIKAHFEDTPVSDSQRFPGEIKGLKFDLFLLKEPDYVMKLMSTMDHCTPTPIKRKVSGLMTKKNC